MVPGRALFPVNVPAVDGRGYRLHAGLAPRAAQAFAGPPHVGFTLRNPGRGRALPSYARAFESEAGLTDPARSRLFPERVNRLGTGRPLPIREAHRGSLLGSGVPVIATGRHTQ